MSRGPGAARGTGTIASPPYFPGRCVKSTAVLLVCGYRKRELLEALAARRSSGGCEAGAWMGRGAAIRLSSHPVLYFIATAGKRSMDPLRGTES